MKALKSDIDFKSRHYLTIVTYCRVLPLEKTKNGYYKCKLYYDNEDLNKTIDWVIPAEYLEENGRFESNQDVYFARWLLRESHEVVTDENGKEQYDDFGNVKVKTVHYLGKLVEFWNTRVFGLGSDK